MDSTSTRLAASDLQHPPDSPSIVTATPETRCYVCSTNPRSCPAGRVGLVPRRSPVGAAGEKHRPRDVLGRGDCSHLAAVGLRGAHRPPRERNWLESREERSWWRSGVLVSVNWYLEHHGDLNHLREDGAPDCSACKKSRCSRVLGASGLFLGSVAARFHRSHAHPTAHAGAGPAPRAVRLNTASPMAIWHLLRAASTTWLLPHQQCHDLSHHCIWQPRTGSRRGEGTKHHLDLVVA